MEVMQLTLEDCANRLFPLPMVEEIRSGPVYTPAQQRFNEIWEACVDLLGYKPITKQDQHLWGMRVRSLAQAGLSAEQVHEAGVYYKHHWPEVDLTINAIEKWVSHMLADAHKSDRAKARAKVNLCSHCEMGGGNHVADCPTVIGTV